MYKQSLKGSQILRAHSTRCLRRELYITCETPTHPVCAPSSATLDQSLSLAWASPYSDPCTPCLGPPSLERPERTPTTSRDQVPTCSLAQLPPHARPRGTLATTACGGGERSSPTHLGL